MIAGLPPVQPPQETFMKSIQLIVHAGLHKTGSSSIQVFCNRQTQCLRESGVLYPNEFNLNGAHHPLVPIVSSCDAFQLTQVLAEWKAQCMASGLNKIVVSSEDFEYINAPALRVLRECAESAELDLKAIIYIRPQSDLIESQYSQQTREGFDIGSPESFFAKSLAHGKYLRLNEILEHFAISLSTAPEVVFYYDKMHRPINAVNDFAKRLDIINVEKFTEPKSYKFNKRLTSSQLELIRSILPMTPWLQAIEPYQRSQILYKFIESFPWPDACINGDECTLSAEEIQICLDHFSQENCHVSAKFLGHPDVINNWYKNKLMSALSRTVTQSQEDLISNQVLDQATQHLAMMAHSISRS